jgi:hypothetical protein
MISKSIHKMNTINNNIIMEEMKALFDGCDSTIDAMQMSEPLFLKYPQYRQLIISYRDSLNYPDNIDLMTKVSSLQSVYETDTKDDALNLKNSLSSRSNDVVYLRTLERIVSRKRNRHGEYNRNRNQKDRLIISKRCPHCGENMRMSEDTTYIICGYPDTHKGYDWRGCCNDWCFSCEKLLCKSWEKDELNVESNRHHDDVCCKSHAKKNGFEYPKDYCHCIHNKYVTRKEYNIDYVSDIEF